MCHGDIGHTSWLGEPRSPAFPQKMGDLRLTRNARYSTVARMAKRRCDLEGCDVEFEPNALNQTHCCRRHSTLHRVRRLRARRAYRKPDSPGPGGGPPPNGGLHATLGGAVEYQRDNSVADLNRYSVKSDTRKPVVPASVNPIAGGEREAA